MVNYEETRRLSAVLIADIAGYTKLIEQDTDGTVAAWQAARADIIDPAIADHSGRVVKFTGDGFLVEFGTVQDAVKCAITMQKGLAPAPLDFRIGINLGDIIDDGQDIHGEGVNIAARIEALADPGGICISGGVYDQVRHRLDYSYEDMGEHKVKHVSDPVRVYGIITEGSVKIRSEKNDISEIDKPSIVIWYDYQRGWSDSLDESRRLAKEWAERAAALPDTDGQACTVLSHLHLLDRNFDAALASGREAILNRPSCTHANAFYANVLLYCCEHDAALHHIKLAMHYSPLHPVFFKDILASAYRALNDHDQAEEAAHSAITADPKDLIARLILISLAVKKNEPGKWAGFTKDIRNIDPSFSIAKFAEAQPYRSQKFLQEFVADLHDAGLPN